MDGIQSDRRSRTNNSWVINLGKSLLIEAIRSVSEWVSESVVIQFTCAVCLCVCKGMMQEFYPLEDSPKFCSLIWGTNLTSNYQWNEVNMKISLFNMHFMGIYAPECRWVWCYKHPVINQKNFSFHFHIFLIINK